VVRLAHHVIVSPTYSSRSPPTVSHNWLISVFVVRMVATSLPYVTFLFLGILSRDVKNNVFVYAGICVPAPWSSLPKSSAKLLTHTSLSVPRERARYSIKIPVSLWTTEFMRRSVSCVALMSSVVSTCAAVATYGGATENVLEDKGGLELRR